MITHIREVHSEEYSDGSRTLGILLNHSIDVNDNWSESFVYLFRETEKGGMYIFFNTMVDMFDYMLYGEDKMKRAYMTDEEFEEYCDAPEIEGTFSEKLKWI